MTNLNNVVASLRKEYSRLEKEMGNVGKALNALGHARGKKVKTTGNTLSKEARNRAAAPQRNPWAKGRKRAPQGVKTQALASSETPDATPSIPSPHNLH